MNMTGLDKWYDYVKTHDRETLWDLLDPDVVFESPVVHTPQHGRDITFKYLWSVGKVLGGPSFAFVREWRNANSAVLEFEAEIDGIKLNGVDIITFADDGRNEGHRGFQTGFDGPRDCLGLAPSLGVDAGERSGGVDKGRSEGHV